MMFNKFLPLWCLGILIFMNTELTAQKRKVKTEVETISDQNLSSLQDSMFPGLKWRNIGPFRGGRATTVCGVIQDPFTYYFGSTGGGVWKTTDAGASWRNISDRYFKTGSVGAIAVSPSDPNVIYVGMGEAPIRVS
ncbi:MAG: hypothetical protein IPL46_12640 [Saprospiraceae bacterium]|nr:hypothetical protein [Saprospiraceae bacterium]